MCYRKSRGGPNSMKDLKSSAREILVSCYVLDDNV